MGKQYKIDFPVEQPTGYGFVFRDKVDYPFNQSAALSQFEFLVESSQPLNAKIEFKTEASRGTAETEHTIEIPAGKYSFSVEVDVKDLSSNLTEVCFFIPKINNEKLTKTDFAILSFKQI